MINKRFSFLSVTAALICLAMPVGSTAQDDEATPALFRDLLEVGQTVGVLSSRDSPTYSLTIFSDEQAEMIKKEQAETAELVRQLDRVQQQLAMEHRIEQRADLLIRRDELNTKRRRPTIASSRRFGTSYQVTNVGKDYVALKREGIERYLPLRSIHSMYRRDKLEQRSFTRGQTGNPYGGGSGRINQRPLKVEHNDAKAVAEVVRRVFAKRPDFQCTVDAESNSLVVTGDSQTRQEVANFVKELDVNFDK